MKVYLSSLAIGLCVGGIYGLLGVRAPAPPLVGLLGLLGMLVGQEVVPWIKHGAFDAQAITHISDHRDQSKTGVAASEPPSSHAG